MWMLWFTFKVIFETIPIGWLCGGGGGPKVIIKLTQSSLAEAWTELGKNSNSTDKLNKIGTSISDMRKDCTCQRTRFDDNKMSTFFPGSMAHGVKSRNYYSLGFCGQT